MSNYSSEILGKIKELSGQFFTPREIAILLGIDENSLFYDIIHKRDKEALNAYELGKLETEQKLRIKIILSADKNSISAQEHLFNLIEKQKSNERQ